MTINTVTTQTLSCLIKVIRKHAHAYPQDAVILKEYVDTFNSLTLPKYSLGVDDNGRLHVIMLLSNYDKFYNTNLPRIIRFVADFIWDYSVEDNTYTSIKDRSGEYRSYSPAAKGVMEIKLV